MKVELNKKYKTVTAKYPVTIVSVDGPYPGFPVVGYVHGQDVPLLCHWTEQGGYPANTHLDLIEVREPLECWLKVSEGKIMASHPENFKASIFHRLFREVID